MQDESFQTSLLQKFSGLALGAIAFTLYSCFDALLKQVTKSVPAPQIMMFNSCIMVITILLYVLLRHNKQMLHTKKLKLHFVRGIIGTVYFLLTLYGVSHIPLVDFYGILFASPLVVALLSHLWLKEPVSPVRWLTTLGGFCGTLIMINAGLQHTPPAQADATIFGYIVMGISVLLLAVNMLLVRRYGAHEHSTSFILYSALVSAPVGMALTLHHGYTSMTLPVTAMLILVGLLCGLAGLLLMTALLRAPASQVMPLQYSQLVWGALFGLFLFNETPRLLSLLGAAVIFLCNFALIITESRRGRAFIANRFFAR